MKSFEVSVRTLNGEPLDQFEIPVKDPETGEIIERRVFDLYAPPDASLLASLTMAARFGKRRGRMTGMQSAAILAHGLDLLGACMNPDQADDLMGIIQGGEFAMDDETLDGLLSWVIETITARPKEKPSGLPPTQSQSGTESTPAAPLTASIPPASESTGS